jgi:hypothetical protein
MSNIRHTHDTFLHFLADNLAGITVREIRYDKDDPNASVLMTNALNVTFLNRSYDTKLSDVQLTLDVCHDDGLTAIDWEEQIATLLQKTAWTEVQDYSGSNPTQLVHQNVFWSSKVQFRPVVAEYYYHSTATITLNHS